MQLKNNEANSGLHSNLAGMYSRSDRFLSLFDCHFCGNLVTTKDLSPIFSPKSASLNSKKQIMVITTDYNTPTQNKIIELIHLCEWSF